MEDFYEIGTVAKIKQMLRLPGDAIREIARMDAQAVFKLLEEEEYSIS